MNWHKNLVEKSLKSFGMSSYQGMWSAFIKGVVITCILFYFIDYNKNSDDNKIKFEMEYSEKFQEDGFDGRLLLMISNNNRAEPRFQINDSHNTQMIFGVDVESWDANKKIVIRSNNKLPTKKKLKYNDIKNGNKKSIKLAKKSNPKNADQKILRLQPKKSKVKENSATANLAVSSPKKNKALLSQSKRLEIVFNSEQVYLSSRFHNDLILLAKISINNNSRIQLRAFASKSGNSPSHARRVSLSRALTVRSYLIRNIDVRALGEPEDGRIKDRVDVVLLP